MASLLPARRGGLTDFMEKETDVNAGESQGHKALPKIFVFCILAPRGGINRYGTDVIGYAVAENGAGLGSHYSSSVGFSKHDMGLTSDWKHDEYRKYYPDGYELEWVDDHENHGGLKAAMANRPRVTSEPPPAA